MNSIKMERQEKIDYWVDLAEQTKSLKQWIGQQL